MSRFLYPSEYYSSTYKINFARYYQMGYRALLFDIDNTLVPHNAMTDERSRRLLTDLRRMGFSICFISNNKEPRVNRFVKELHVEGLPDPSYVYKAGKPKRTGYLNGLRKMRIPIRRALFIGDQLFTDIWGANRAGIRSILVKQIDKKEEIQIVLKRILERPILFFYRRRHPIRA
ncbi:MAG: HAD-IIIA family hydrolase [Eubacterium sp.]|nr:HAD-IIIA family hydrolase [Eubacterium sp.]